MEPDFDVIIPVVLAVVLSLVGLFIVVAIIRSVRRRGLAPQGLPAAPQGLPARGLVLTSDRVSTGVTMNGRRFESRRMTLDVEIPGRPPYLATGTFLVPRGLVEALPGSLLELVVHPTDMSQVTVLGPGGFTGPWLSYGPPNAY
ncbi:MAG TPA: hypothetical protein VGL81_13430 [Polyangiaceae bacterium]